MTMTIIIIIIQMQSTKIHTYNVIIDFYHCVGRFVIVARCSPDTMKSFIYIKYPPTATLQYATRPYYYRRISGAHCQNYPVASFCVAISFCDFSFGSPAESNTACIRIECHSFRSSIQFPFVDPQYSLVACVSYRYARCARALCTD